MFSTNNGIALDSKIVKVRVYFTSRRVIGLNIVLHRIVRRVPKIIVFPHYLGIQVTVKLG